MVIKTIKLKAPERHELQERGVTVLIRPLKRQYADILFKKRGSTMDGDLVKRVFDGKTAYFGMIESGRGDAFRCIWGEVGDILRHRVSGSLLDILMEIMSLMIVKENDLWCWKFSVGLRKQRDI